jgi:hypothetical protein
MFRRVEVLAVVLAACLTGCAPKSTDNRVEFQMGERANVGPLTYNVVETAWRSQLGADFKARFPQQRFLLVTISVTNGGGKEVSVPLFSLQDENGKIYQESENGDGVDNWFGLLRTIAPAQTQQGKLAFDVPLGAYRLRVTDGGDPGAEKFAWISIPLRMDTDSGDALPAIPAPAK